jgi:hemoglobin/transferrin/lactoferrin receptor protein
MEEGVGDEAEGGLLPDEPLVFSMDEVIVTATRSARVGFDAPYTTDVVGSTLIRERAYRTTPEALRDIPGVMVQKTAHGQGSPFIRGFTGFRNVFLIDGIRLNNSVFRDGPNQYWNTVDPLSLERIEIVKGPSSVLYGSDAIGGTVAAITKSPTTYGPGLNAGGALYSRWSSAESSIVGRAEVSVTQDDTTGALLGLSLKDFGDVEAGAPTGEQPETGYEEYDIDAKFEHWLSDSARLVAAHQTVRQNNVPRTHRTIFAVPFEGTTVGSDLRRELDQERNLTYVQLISEDTGGAIDDMRLNMSWQRQKETRDRIRGSGARELQGFEVDTLAVWGQFTSETPIGTLTYGAEWYRDIVDSFSSTNEIQGPVADDATYDLVGVYAQSEMDLSERASLIVGGRFNYARADADSVEDPQTGERISLDDDWSSLVGSARLTYAVVPERVKVFGGVSQGFRAPNLSDLTRLDTARTDEIETPSPGLDPEEFLSYEVGVKTRGSWWAAQASWFYTDIEDLIIRTPTGVVIDGENEVTKRNSDGGFTQGFELSASVKPHRSWTVFGHLAWLDGEVDTFPTSDADPVREPIDRLMPLNGLVGVRFDDPSDRFWVEGTLTLSERADRLSSRDAADTSRIPPGGTPGYAVYTLRSGVRVADNVDLTVALENLTDEDYRVHGSGQNEPGRNLVIGLQITF